MQDPRFLFLLSTLQLLQLSFRRQDQINRGRFRLSHPHDFLNSRLRDWPVLRASSDVRRYCCREAAAQLSTPALTRHLLQPSPYFILILFRRLISYQEPFLLRSSNLVE
jgi:hypothetical protein